MLVSALAKQAHAQPDALAIIDDRGRWTYAQTATLAGQIAGLLPQKTSAAHVGVLLPPGLGFVGSFYGTLAAGKSVVPINYLLGEREVAHVIADSGIDTVLTAPPLAGKMAQTKLNVIDLTQLPPPEATSIAALANLKPALADDLAVLMYTSGTSGLPKGVMLSHGNLQSDVDDSIVAAGLNHDHRFLGVIPLFHAFGMTAMMLAPIQLGAPVIYLGRFSPVAVLNAIRQHKVSLMFGVPSMYAAIANLKNAAAEDFKSIYAMLSGGEPLSRALYDKFLERFNVPLLEGFGLTETSPVVSLNTPQARKLGSVGKPLPSVTVKIADENNNATKREEIGEVWLKGPMIMQGYYNLPEATAAALTPDRFFKTGDLGKVDSDGYLHITGRKKEMIIIAGEKAFPREIEEVLLKHPAVAEAAVIGKKDESRGEMVVAFVILKPELKATPEELRNFYREQNFPGWKTPREIRIVEDLPRSPTGKVLKRVLAEQAAKP